MILNRTLFRSFAILIVLLVFSLACSLSGDGGSSGDPTLQALGTSVAQTSTAAAAEEGGGGNELATAQAEATQRSAEVNITQTALAATHDETQLATATVAAPIIAELPRYDVDPQKGRVGFMHDPVSIDIDEYHGFDFANDYMQVIARDFVLAGDITWDTQYGASGCGFMFRSNGDQKFPDQYMVLASRIGQGHVVFTALADGEMANVHDYYANTLDPGFAWQNGTTNRLAIVARGNIIEIYTNGTKIGVVDTTQPPSKPVYPSKPRPPTDQTNLDAVKQYQKQLEEYQDMVDQAQSNYQIALGNYETREAVYEEGFVGMIAASESGHTVCTFENTWLWLIEEE